MEILFLIYGYIKDFVYFEELMMVNVLKGYFYFEVEELKIGFFLIIFMEIIYLVVCYVMWIVEEVMGKVFVFIGDLGYLESFVDFVKEVDLFLVDVYLFEGNEYYYVYFILKEVGELVKLVNVKKFVFIYLF